MDPAVLVIDDHLDTCRSLVRLFRTSGISAHGLYSGDEAIAFLRQAVPKLVFLDVMMPGMNGLEVLRAIRESERCKGVPVIMYSAVSDDEQRRRAMELGANDFLVKGSMDFKAIEQIASRYAAPE